MASGGAITQVTSRICSHIGAALPNRVLDVDAGNGCLPIKEILTGLSGAAGMTTAYRGKTALLQGPVSQTSQSRMHPVWGSPEDLNAFHKQKGYLYNMRLDFAYDPTLYGQTAKFHNCQIFIVKIKDFARARLYVEGAGAHVPPYRPGVAGWQTADSILDAVGDIDSDKLTRGIHYTSGTINDGNVQLSTKYFDVMAKWNLSANMKSLNTLMLPGNTMMNWSYNCPLGRTEIKRFGQVQADNTEATAITEPSWVNVDTHIFDPTKQIHLLMFSNSFNGADPGFGPLNARPYLAVRKTLTFGSSLV